MTVTSKDPRKIHDAYKEAVVDSILNNLSARLAGRGDFYRLIYGNRPSAALISEFIVPMPEGERNSDEEASPIQISAHGMDFQISREGEREPLSVELRCAVYVRLLPAAEELMPGALLEPKFPLRSEVRRELNRRIREGLARLREELKSGRADARRHPEWAQRSEAVRRAAHEQLGIPFDNTLDRQNPEDESNESPSIDSDSLGDEGSNAPPPIEARARGMLPDNVVDAIRPPAKWLRLDLDIPPFTFSPATAAVDSKRASDELNAAIAQQLKEWADSDEPLFGGKQWGFRDVEVRPSDLRDWNKRLDEIRGSSRPIVLPSIKLHWDLQVRPDPLERDRLSVHIALENWSQIPAPGKRKQVEPALFQVRVSVTLPGKIHRPLKLDRVRPSYRYNEYLHYPALGFNGGVAMDRVGDKCVLNTTWAPRYVLPRIEPIDRESEGICTEIAKLAEPSCLQGLVPLINSYEDWLKKAETYPVGHGLSGATAAEQEAEEREKLQLDLKLWRAELHAIRVGIEILHKSAAHWSGPGPQQTPYGIPFEAWLSMNAALSKVAAAKGYRDWRLFQLAFILACIPAFATRIPEFHEFYTPEVAEQANAVTLLYFATGGGKSEAFLGLLVFVLFLDRLRGKHYGVSALMRYPLRLLTLQQARRTFTTLGAAEEIRHLRGHPGEPFSLGFWVGSSNTPNWHRDDAYNSVPTLSAQPLDTEQQLLRESAEYKNLKERWLKLDRCPFCNSGAPLALRRVPGPGGNALGHLCTATREDCSWNARFSDPTPLPFYVVDEDIYDLAPSVLLGTVDKLSALGQSQGTIRKFFGMFGFAPFIEKGTDRLFVPQKAKDWDGEPGTLYRPLFPTYQSGERRFFDPFPALLIQDEAHLLEESLGTFAGLFESALEAAFDSLAPLLGDQVTFAPNSRERRRIKVIAASATVNEPHRQMRNLYQRATIQFPHPGPHLYRSFYAEPKQPDDSVVDAPRRALADDDIELRSHWARVYVSVLTNGHKHTVAMAAVLGHYHLIISGLYQRLRSDDPQQTQAARNELIAWVSEGPLKGQHAQVLASADGSTLLTLIDLHRIALTYVTNKKGGDQVIDTERLQFAKLHEGTPYEGQRLESELISGAVSAADIQRVVRQAEKRVRPGEPFPDLNSTLRSVIATSAVSHGVDVEEFNAMFFAGMPSDIAEYIQASSRVGRTHVGFSLLVPVPQRYRDRFILEIHDIFHRFLERMILPAAVDRWAEKALIRVVPSFFQEYVCGVNVIQSLCSAPDDKKGGCRTHAFAAEVRAFLNQATNLQATERFLEDALGLQAHPPPKGADYYRALVKRELESYRQDMEVERLANSRLGYFFEVRNSRLRPMTSLRDVDEPGVIHEARYDASASHKAPEGATARAMRFIRRGSGADIDDTSSSDEARE